MTSSNEPLKLDLNGLLAGSVSRRHFLRSTAMAAAGALVMPYISDAQVASKKFNVAVIGAGGKGSSDTDDTFNVGGNIAALCDVDGNTLNSRGKKYPNAKLYKDFRKMLDEVGKSIDAVTVSTPDHCHAIAATTAMKMGKHVYCQKPLTQTVYEARVMRDLAKKKKLVTQMGNQGSAGSGLRRAVEVIQAGVIGPVRQLHVWSNRPIWPQGMDRPEGSDPVPAELDWDLWLGPAQFRPFKKGVYHDFKWRGWQDFGTGALGDMACHTVNMPFRALKLGYPTSVMAEAPAMNKESYPLKSKIKFEFPARDGMPPLTFWWYDGGNPKPNNPTSHDGNNKPSKEILTRVIEMHGEQLPGSGCLLIGDKGQIFSPDDYGSQFFVAMTGEKELVSGDKHDAVKVIPQTIPRSPGHNKEWANAILNGGPAPYSEFAIAAYLTEIILLGCIAMRVGVGRNMEWNGPKMKSPNCPEAAKFVKRNYRKGWKV